MSLVSTSCCRFWQISLSWQPLEYPKSYRDKKPGILGWCARHCESSFTWPHPSILLAVAALLLIYQASATYHKPVPAQTLQALQSVKQGVKRAAALQIAMQALAMATWGSLGMAVAVLSVALLVYPTLNAALERGMGKRDTGGRWLGTTALQGF